MCEEFNVTIELLFVKTKWHVAKCIFFQQKEKCNLVSLSFSLSLVSGDFRLKFQYSRLQAQTFLHDQTNDPDLQMTR